jgi:hypothetical protein
MKKAGAGAAALSSRPLPLGGTCAEVLTMFRLIAIRAVPGAACSYGKAVLQGSGSDFRSPFRRMPELGAITVSAEKALTDLAEGRLALLRKLRGNGFFTAPAGIQWSDNGEWIGGRS